MNEYIIVHKQHNNLKTVEHMNLETNPPEYKQKKLNLLYLTLQLFYLVKYLL